jgi:hypothetical protein
MLQAYLTLPDGVVSTPESALVTGYQYLTDGSTAVADQLQQGMTNGSAPLVTRLIDPAEQEPEIGVSWSANDLRQEILAAPRYDFIYLAGHFSASRALAADYDEVDTFASSELAGIPDDLLANTIIFSSGCHSGYNVVQNHAIPNITEELDWAQAFAQEGATLIAGTGYQYGDGEGTEYGERLYLEFTHNLRYGTGPIPVGKALVGAKQDYLANASADLNGGVFEKTILISTLFGLPMLQVDLPNRLSEPVIPPAVTTTDPVAAGTPGHDLGLHYIDVSFNPSLTEETRELYDPLADETVTTTFYTSDDGFTAIPAHPYLPRAVYNVSNEIGVMRGTGFRGGMYSDQLNVQPYTSVVATELAGSHPTFYSEHFYPIQPWLVNYYDFLIDPDNGDITLMLNPLQYQSNGVGSAKGTMRKYAQMDFRLFYSGETGPTAESAAPAIGHVLSTLDDSGVDDLINFEVQISGVIPNVAGDALIPGVNQAWITFTSLSGEASDPWYGKWQPLDLSLDDPNRPNLWTADILLPANVPAEDVRYIVQAVGANGLVSIVTNFGAYFALDIDPGLPTLPQGINENPPQPTTLALTSAPSSGQYGETASFTAKLTNANGNLAGKAVTFGLGSQSLPALTNGSGEATVAFYLLNQPGAYQINAAFAGDATNKAAQAGTPFTLAKQPSTLTLSPASLSVPVGDDGSIMAALVNGDGAAIREKSVLFVIRDSSDQIVFVRSAITGFNGTTALSVRDAALPEGNYKVEAYFGGNSPVPAIKLNSAFFEPSSAAPPTNLTIGDGISESLIYISTKRPGFIRSDRVAYRAEDILLYDANADAWSLFFDGSDVGLPRRNLEAFAFLDDGSILMSFSWRVKDLPGVGQVRPEDIVRFEPTTTGENTTGTFSMYFDGSDVGLSARAEAIDGLALAPDGELVISVKIKAIVPGSAGTVKAQDEDLLLFDGSLGPNTSGTWSLYFDGSDVGLTRGREDIAGVGIDPLSGKIYLSMLGRFQANGISGSSRDIVACTPLSLAEATQCDFEMFWQGDDHDLGRQLIDGLEIR